MDLTFSKEQQKIKNKMNEFVQREVMPIADNIDKTRSFPKQNILKLGNLGAMGITIPEKYGGINADTLSFVLAIEELSYGCASHGVICSSHNSLCCNHILKYGTELQKEKYLIYVWKHENHLVQ